MSNFTTEPVAQPADSGRVGGGDAAYRYNAPSWKEISAAEGDAIAALKVLHHAGSLINAQLPGTAQLCAKWPSLIGTIKAALAAQVRVDLLNGEMLQAGADALDRFVAWESSNDEERYACIEAVWRAMRERAPTAALTAQGQGEAVAKVRHFDYRGIARNGFSQEAQMLDGAPVLPDGTPLYTRPATAASPAGVPDATEVHADLPPGYRMATRDGDYWPLFGDSYCTNHAFPTRELAALEAWKQAHEKLNDSMESIRRLSAGPSSPVEPAGVPDDMALIPCHYASNIQVAACVMEQSNSVLDRREASVLRRIAAMLAAAPSAPEGDGGAE